MEASKGSDRWNRTQKLGADKGIRLLVQLDNLFAKLLIKCFVELPKRQLDELHWGGFVGFKDASFESLLLARRIKDSIQLRSFWGTLLYKMPRLPLQGAP